MRYHLAITKTNAKLGRFDCTGHLTACGKKLNACEHFCFRRIDFDAHHDRTMACKICEAYAAKMKEVQNG